MSMRWARMRLSNCLRSWWRGEPPIHATFVQQQEYRRLGHWQWQPVMLCLIGAGLMGILGHLTIYSPDAGSPWDCLAFGLVFISQLLSVILVLGCAAMSSVGPPLIFPGSETSEHQEVNREPIAFMVARQSCHWRIMMPLFVCRVLLSVIVIWGTLRIYGLTAWLPYLILSHCWTLFQVIAMCYAIYFCGWSHLWRSKRPTIIVPLVTCIAFWIAGVGIMSHLSESRYTVSVLGMLSQTDELAYELRKLPGWPLWWRAVSSLLVPCLPLIFLAECEFRILRKQMAAYTRQQALDSQVPSRP